MLALNFLRVIAQIKQRLGHTPVPIQLAIGSEDNFQGQIDLMTMEAVYWNDADKGMTPRREAIPAELQELAEEWRSNMVEAAAEASEELMNKYLKVKSFPSRKSRPLCVSVLSLVKSSWLFAVLPSRTRVFPWFSTPLSTTCLAPTDIPAIKGTDPDDEEKQMERHADDNEPFSALAFKIATDPFVGT